MRRAWLAVAVLVLGAWGPCAPVDDGGGDVAGMSTAGYAAVAAGEDWHYVGDTDEPAFENSWGNVSLTKYNLAFRIREAGVVDVEGSIVGGVSGDAVFTLPSGYLPSGTAYMFASVISSGPTVDHGSVTVEASGAVTVGWTSGVTPTEVIIAGQFFLTPPTAP